jgi:hypothetical protein
MVLSPKELAETESKPIAVAWVAAARAALANPMGELTIAALHTNFSWASLAEVGREAHLRHVATSFTSIAAVLLESSRRFKDVSLKQAASIFGEGGVPPAYATFGDHVYFTPHFRPHDSNGGFGPLCRAAMVVHESVHVFDRRSGEPEIHISEWDARFDTRTSEQQLHNPSAYASFAAQVHERRLEWPRTVRFGAGNPGL